MNQNEATELICRYKCDGYCRNPKMEENGKPCNYTYALSCTEPVPKHPNQTVLQF